jgi:cell division protein FtsZ
MTGYSLGVLGVGTAGKRIIEKISFALPDAMCISLDDSEWKVFGGKVREITLSSDIDRSVGNVKRLAWLSSEDIINSFTEVRNVVVISGLGGTVGSSVSPIIAYKLKEAGKKVFGIAIMPFKFEKNRLFKAAVGLRKLKNSCEGIVIIDNEDFIEKAPATPLLKAYELENDWISKFISNLFGLKEKYCLNENEVNEFMHANKNNILAIGRAEGPIMAEEATLKISNSIRKQSESAVKDLLMFVVGWKEISLGDVSTIVSTLKGTTLCEGEVRTGYYLNNGRDITLYAVASVKSTRFDDWDPISSILTGRELDLDVCSGMKLIGQECDSIQRID